MFRWVVCAKTTTHASRAAVWQLWTDVASWPKWDSDLQWSKIEGNFTAGTQGRLKPKGWFTSKFVITNVAHLESFEDVTKMPFTRVTLRHQLRALPNEKLEILHEVEVRGLLAPLLKLTLKRQFVKGLPKAVESLAKLAEGSK